MQANPFKPTAGRTPPVLVGRDEIINDFIDGLNNGPGAPERLMRITGMRGMGKTVMLNELGRVARESGWTVVDETAEEGFCRRLLERVRPKTWVKSFSVEPNVLGVSLGGVELERASLSLREAMAAALEKRDSGLLITLDEVQDASLDEMRALAVAVQHVIREEGNIAFVFAGLPSMVDSVVNGKTLTFLRRAVPVELGLIERGDVRRSLKQAIVDSGMSIGDEALETMTDTTCCYPFMIQLVGYHSWQAAYRACGDGAEVLPEHVALGSEKACVQFDRMVIEPALQRLPASTRQYLLAMAEDRGVPSKTGAVAERLGRDIRALSSVRQRLIEANVVESRARGTVEFAIPRMADYLLAHRGEMLDELGAD